jgi:hypothetical protein
MAEPTADVLQQFASGAVRPPDARPQSWILSFFSRSRGLLNSSSIQFRAHGGMALLRDNLSGHERYVTRFHAARQYLAESVTRAAEAGNAEVDKQRRVLLNAVKELEQIHGERSDSQSTTDGPRRASVSVEELAAPGRSVTEDMPLSFFSDEESQRVVALVTVDEVPSEAEQVLSRLREELTQWEPASETLCAQVLEAGEGFDGAIQRTFSVMSSAEVTANQRAWLSQLGAFLINLSSRWSQAVANQRQAAAPKAPSVAAPAAVEEKLELALEPDDDAQTLEAPSAEPSSTPKHAVAAPNKPAKKSAAKTKPTTMAPSKTRTVSSTARPFNAQHRRKLKDFMAERIQRWQRDTGVATEADVLLLLAKAISKVEKDKALVKALLGPLKAPGFMQAQRQIEGAVEASSGKQQMALKSLAVLCQDIQTAYFQRLREMLDIPFFNQLELRREVLAELAAHWAEHAEQAGGANYEEARCVADKAVLGELVGLIRQHTLPDSVRGISSALSGLDNLVSAHRLVSAPSRSDPLSALFRSECKGLLEDLMIRSAFDLAPRAGWLRMIETLGEQTPRSESELVAIVSRKLDAVGQTGVHENFLNPSKRLQVRNFLQWVEHGYRLSPHYQANDGEEAVLKHTQWLLEQILSMQFEDVSDTSGGQEGSALDAFLAAESESGHGVYNIYWQEILRRFDGYWNRHGRA